MELKPGARGTVDFVNKETRVVYVNWDNGQRSGLVPHEDLWEILVTDS